MNYTIGISAVFAISAVNNAHSSPNSSVGVSPGRRNASVESVVLPGNASFLLVTLNICLTASAIAPSPFIRLPKARIVQLAAAQFADSAQHLVLFLGEMLVEPGRRTVPATRAATAASYNCREIAPASAPPPGSPASRDRSGQGQPAPSELPSECRRQSIRVSPPIVPLASLPAAPSPAPSPHPASSRR